VAIEIRVNLAEKPNYDYVPAGHSFLGGAGYVRSYRALIFWQE
jgi:hypothetical protein